MREIAIAVVPTLALACVLALAGCGSAPRAVAQQPQYCHTSQTIKTQNGEKVNSETTLECTDNQAERLRATRMGMAANCGEFYYWMRIGDRDVQRKGISCQKTNGTWEVVNTGRN